jgi:hypothetical protein
MQLSGVGPDHRHGTHQHRWQRARLQVRAPAVRLAGPGARAVQLGRQAAPGAHHQSGRPVPAQPAGAGCPSSAGSGQEQEQDPISRWAVSLEQRRGYWRAMVAIAAKNARMCWAVLSAGEAFRLPA